MSSTQLDLIAQRNDAVAEYQEELLKFDSELNGGDQDGQLELPDIDPRRLESQFQYLSSYTNSDLNLDRSRTESLSGSSQKQLQHLIKLHGRLIDFRNNLNLAVPADRFLTAEEIFETFKVLFGDDYHLLAEDLSDSIYRKLGDSLTRGMGATSDGALGDRMNYLMSKILLDAMGIDLDAAQALTQNQAFPYERDHLSSPGIMGFALMGAEQVWSLLTSDGSAGDFYPLSDNEMTKEEIEAHETVVENETPKQKSDRLKRAQAVLMANSGSTTADSVRNQLSDNSPQTGSTGRAFIEFNHSRVYGELGAQTVLSGLLDTFPDKDPETVSVLVMMLGANDLFTAGYKAKNRVVYAPKQTPELFRKSIQKAAQQVADKKFGSNFRPMFMAPFDVSVVLLPVPSGVKYNDGSEIPEGSAVLYHHQLIGAHDGYLPPEVVFSKEDIAQLKQYQKEYFSILQEELVVKNGWQVFDLQTLFSIVIDEVKTDPIKVSDVENYGKLDYSLRDLFSLDNQHPSESGYLLLALLQQALLMESGYALSGYQEFLKSLPVDKQQRNSYIIKWVKNRFAEIVRSDPNFYRPQRMENDELEKLPQTIEGIFSKDKTEFLNSIQSILPLLSDDVLIELINQLSSEEIDTDQLDHQEKVGQFISQIRGVENFNAIKEDLKEILLSWSEKYQSHQLDIARTMDLNFKAFGSASDDSSKGGRFGLFRNFGGVVEAGLKTNLVSPYESGFEFYIGAGGETNSLRIAANQNIRIDGGLRLMGGSYLEPQADLLFMAGITTQLFRVGPVQVFNHLGAGVQIGLQELADGSFAANMTDQFSLLFTHQDLTGRANETSALYLRAENLSHLLDITPGYLPPTFSLGIQGTFVE